MSDSTIAGFLRKTFSERSQKLLCGSLKAPDGAALQHVLGKLNEEEKACESQNCCPVCPVVRLLQAKGLHVRTL